MVRSPLDDIAIDQLLKDIGVLSAGHRLRIRNAIAKLAERETAGLE